jgi:hypothetical protein
MQNILKKWRTFSQEHTLAILKNYNISKTIRDAHYQNILDAMAYSFWAGFSIPVVIWFLASLIL